MKRLLAAIVLLCLLAPACALAFDLSPYELAPLGNADFVTDLMPLSRGSHLLIYNDHQEDDPYIYRLQRWENGTLTLDYQLPSKQYARYSPILYQDGSLAVLQSTGRIEAFSQWKNDYILYDFDGGQLVRPREFEGSPYWLLFYGSGFAGIGEHGEGESELILYDDSGRRAFFRYTIPFENAFVQDAFESRGVISLLIKQYGSPSIPDCILLRVRADGEMEWVYHTTDEGSRYNNLLADGQGGFIMTGSLVSDYKQYTATHLNAAGKGYWSKTLSTPNAITHPSVTRENPDGTATLYGYCVAASRGLYTIFAMTLDAQGNTLALDVRDYSARADTSPKILLSPEGEAFVYSYTQPDLNEVLIPFDDLPIAEDPGITLE